MVGGGRMKRWLCCICETEGSHQREDLELHRGPEDFNDGRISLVF